METYTYKEILQQPAMWQLEYARLKQHREEIKTFMDRFLMPETDVVLTGAGTSAFIGDSLTPILRQGRMKNCRAVATTDLVTHAEAYIDTNRPLLLISFARSGNSPESVAAVKKVNHIHKDVAHIFITCNENGELAKMGESENVLIVLLPAETNDKSLAMTSSFSTMWISCVMLSHIDDLDAQVGMINATVENARYILDHCQENLKAIAGRGFERGVFLGSGPMNGVAEECHLKLQELTDGAVVCKFDSFLGFRHGPKAVVNPQSLVVYLVWDEECVQRYERDLIAQVDGNNHLTAQVAVCLGKPINTPVKFDLQIVMPNGSDKTGMYGYLPFVLVGQLMGFFTSISHGLNPDTPSVSGNISRVVEGVIIYE